MSTSERLLPAPINSRGRPRSAATLRPSPWVLVRLEWPRGLTEVRAGRVTAYTDALYCVEWQAHPRAHLRQTWVRHADVAVRLPL